MRANRFKSVFIATLLGLLFFRTVALADVDRLNISQIVQKGNDVYLYVSAFDDVGVPVTDSFSPEQFSVSVNKGTPMPVQELSVFDSLGEGISYTFCIDVSKSVTEQEMLEIRDAITAFVNGMSGNDYAKIVTIGAEITAVCDSTQDRNALSAAVQSIDRVADYTYLYKGISYALDGQRKSIDVMPNRAAVILFTDGMDDSDGAASEEQVLLDIDETRIPIYVVGLKGQDPEANLNSVGQIARRSGGSVYSYNDMGIADAVQTISNIMRSMYQLHVLPTEENFGANDLTWSVVYNSNGYSVSSPNYDCPLGLEGVVFAPPETEMKTMPATETETVTETETPTETDTKTETEESTETKMEAEPEQETKAKRSGMEKLEKFIKENMILCAASGLVLLGLLILLGCLLFRKKDKGEPERDSFKTEMSPLSASEETVDELPDKEETIDEIYSYDDEATVDERFNNGTKLEFEITFDGHTETEVWTLKDQLILGRGPECDVDVVLHSMGEEGRHTSRKHSYILSRPDGLYVKDNSKNKTYLNGKEITGETVLKNEDVLQLGKAVVRIRILSY